MLLAFLLTTAWQWRAVLANRVGEPVLSLISLSATKWCVRASAIKRVCSTYSQILEVLSCLRITQFAENQGQKLQVLWNKPGRFKPTMGCWFAQLCLVHGVKWWPKPCSHRLLEHMTLKPVPSCLLVNFSRCVLTKMPKRCTQTQCKLVNNSAWLLLFRNSSFSSGGNFTASYAYCGRKLAPTALRSHRFGSCWTQLSTWSAKSTLNREAGKHRTSRHKEHVQHDHIGQHFVGSAWTRQY